MPAVVAQAVIDSSVNSIDQLREHGNELFRGGEYLKAAAAYTKALNAAGGAAAAGREAAVLYSNRSAALLKLSKLAKALTDAESAARADPSWDKAHLRMALALEQLARLPEALECYRRAQGVAPDVALYAARAKALAREVSRAQQRGSKCATGTQSEEQRRPGHAAALAFAEEQCGRARELATQHGGSFPPELHILPAWRSGSGAGAPQAVRAAHAFASPDAVAGFVDDMRARCSANSAAAVVAIVPKTAIAFPQVWLQSAWPSAFADGVFVQLQALLPPPQRGGSAADAPGGGSDSGPTDQAGGAAVACSGNDTGTSQLLRRSWFIPMRRGKPPGEAAVMGQEFDLLPPLLRS